MYTREGRRNQGRSWSGSWRPTRVIHYRADMSDGRDRRTIVRDLLALAASRALGDMRRWSLPLAAYAPTSMLEIPARSVTAARRPAVDIHAHLGTWLTRTHRWAARDVDALVAAMDEANVAAIVNLDGRWDRELQANIDRYEGRYPTRFRTFCHLDWSLLSSDRPTERLVAQLRRSAAAGAAGVKVWKDLGLRVRDDSRRLVQLDDARLADVWDVAGELGLPVLVHTADPVAFWRPVDRRNERFEELAHMPEWRWGSRRVPSHGQLIATFERMLAGHRQTTFIGAHVANYVENLAVVGRLLDDHPNLVVDVAARQAELGRQPYTARAFLLKYHDRVLWGTDSIGFDAGRYRTWFRLLETADEAFAYSDDRSPNQGRWFIYGLDLPSDVLDEIYASNALRLLPSLMDSVRSETGRGTGPRLSSA